MDSDLMGWRALVGTDYRFDTVSIVLGQRRHDGYDMVVSIANDTTLRTVGIGEEGQRLSLPTLAARALRKALDEHFGAPPDDYRARYEVAQEALNIERLRVDSLLALIGRPQ